MSDTTHDPRDLVMTEAEAPPPPAGPTPIAGDMTLLNALRDLAQRAGGLQQLRDAVDYLIQTSGH